MPPPGFEAFCCPPSGFSMNLNVQKQLWFGHIYQSHQSALLSWFKHKLQHHHQSEDLSQEVFCRALKSGYNYEQIKEPKAWLLGIAKHVMIDHWRHQQIERLYLEALSHLPKEFHPSAEHEICIRETLHQVHQVLPGPVKAVGAGYLQIPRAIQRASTQRQGWTLRSVLWSLAGCRPPHGRLPAKSPCDRQWRSWPCARR